MKASRVAEARILLASARRRNLPFLQIAGEPDLWQFGWGKRSRQFRGAISGDDQMIGARIASDKLILRQFLRQLGMPQPKGILVEPGEDFGKASERLSFPCAVHPLTGNAGITRGIDNAGSLEKAVMLAREHAERVFIEEDLSGDDHHLLVIDGALAAAIGPENRSGQSGRGPSIAMAEITAQVHPQLAFMAAQLAMGLGFRAASIAYRTTAIDRPLDEVGGGVIDVAPASLAPFVAAGIDPDRLGSQLLGTNLGRIPLALLVGSRGGAAQLKRLLETCPDGVGIASASPSNRSEHVPENGYFQTLLLDRRVGAGALICTAEDLPHAKLGAVRFDLAVIAGLDLPGNVRSIVSCHAEKMMEVGDCQVAAETALTFLTQALAL